MTTTACYNSNNNYINTAHKFDAVINMAVLARIRLNLTADHVTATMTKQVTNLLCAQANSAFYF